MAVVHHSDTRAGFTLSSGAALPLDRRKAEEDVRRDARIQPSVLWGLELPQLTDFPLSARDGRRLQIKDIAVLEHWADEPWVRRDAAGEVSGAPPAVLAALTASPWDRRKAISTDVDRVLKSPLAPGLGVKLERRIPKEFEPLVARAAEQIETILPPAIKLARHLDEAAGAALRPAARGRIGVKVFGPDLDVLQRTAVGIQDSLGKVPGVVNVQLERGAIPGKSASFVFDREETRPRGVQIEDVYEALSAILEGCVIGEVGEEGLPVKLVVRFGCKGLEDPRALDIPLLDVPGGGTVSLRQLGTVNWTSGPEVIYREGRERRVALYADVAGRDPADVLADIHRALRPVEDALAVRGGGCRIGCSSH
jgi:hypothetical protein